MRRNIIIDCDPGHDDAVAIMVALANSSDFNVLGITTVCGNTTIENATKNALRVLQICGKDLPVSAGYQHPLLNKVQTAAFVHGESGMEGPQLFEPRLQPTGKHAVEFLKETIENSAQKVTLIPLGPLTNIAIFLKTYPQLIEKIEAVSLMGGSIYGGNILPKAEFNIYQDPEAAKIVFESGVKIIMAPIEACNEGGVYFAESDKFKDGGTVSKFAYELFEYYSQYCKKNGWEYTVIYDMTAVIYLLHPEYFESEPMRVSIETQGAATRGMTVCDFRGGAHIGECQDPVTVLTHIKDRDKFVQVLFDSLKTLDESVA
ncbi:MAG: nucleoside hydrolase [Erysipelotrichaceae bacterium]